MCLDTFLSLRAAFAPAVILAFSFVAVGCSDDSAPETDRPPGQVVQFASIEVSPPSISFSSALAEVDDQTATVTILSSGGLNLHVESLRFASSADSPVLIRFGEARLLAGGEVIEILPAPGEADFAVGRALAPGDTASAGVATALEIDVVLPVESAEWSGALLDIRSNADGDELVTVPLTLQAGTPRIDVAPLAIEFDAIGAGQVETRSVGISNSGSASLVVSELEFQGSDAFSLSWPGAAGSTGSPDPPGPVRETHLPGGVIVLDPPMTIAPSGSVLLTVRFAPEAAEPAAARVYVRSNDPNAPSEGVEVVFLGNQNVPCIQLSPKSVVNFGARPLGHVAEVPVDIVNCGNEPLRVFDLRWQDNDAGPFSVDLTDMAGFEAGQLPSQDYPLVIPINGKASATMRFVPLTVSPETESGEIVPEIRMLDVIHDAFEGISTWEIRGAGTESGCPTGVIELLEGPEVIPQTLLHLDGSASWLPSGEIVSWTWSVIQPVGSAGVFEPSPYVAAPAFRVNVAGLYTFSLMVADESGNLSCEAAEYEVAVIPDEAIHVELVWSTPRDPDETDEGAGAGTDLDLHFAHELAGGPDLDGNGLPDGWFDVPFDTFWFNPEPNWASLEPNADDDPSLDRDDTDGAGPENLNLNTPEDGRAYRVAVHYWNAHGFGDAYATVFVYLHGQLVWSAEDVLLTEFDMWEAAVIHWSSSIPEVVAVQNPFGGPQITPDYCTSLFTPGNCP